MQIKLLCIYFSNIPHQQPDPKLQQLRGYTNGATHLFSQPRTRVEVRISYRQRISVTS